MIRPLFYCPVSSYFVQPSSVSTHIEKLYKHTHYVKSQIFTSFHEKAGDYKNIVKTAEKRVFHDTTVEKSNSVLDHIQTLGCFEGV